MKEYKLLSKGLLEPELKFERRLNEICQKGWKPISICCNKGNRLTVLLESPDKENYY